MRVVIYPIYILRSYLRTSVIFASLPGHVDCYYPPANFPLATGRANAFVRPCPLLLITLP